MVDSDIREVTDELAELLQRKRNQYGTGNLAVFGELGILVRTTDKVFRIKNLLETGREPEDESIDDSWFDTAGYAVLALMGRRRDRAGRVLESNGTQTSG